MLPILLLLVPAHAGETLDVSKAGRPAVVHNLGITTVAVPEARPLTTDRLTLASSGAAVAFTDDGVWLDGQVLMRFAAWGRGDNLTEVAPSSATIDCAPTPLASGGCVDGLTWATPGIDTWWVQVADALELGWTVHEAPEGRGALTVSLEVDGALTLAATETGATVLSPDGRIWSVGGIAAYDADGVSLPTELEVGHDGLQLRVDDRLAHYPIVIDPLFSTPYASLTGTTGQFGLSMVRGDFNLDGAEDLAVGSPSAGTVQIYFGSRFTRGMSSTPGYTRTRTSGYGLSLAASDVTGDGHDELIVGRENGFLEVISRQANNTWNVYPVVLPSGAVVGRSMGGGMDVDADGLEDVAVVDTNHVVHVCYGGATVPLISCTTRIQGFGARPTLAGAEDLDGDGYGDLVVGDWSAAIVHMIFGSSSGPGSPLTLTPAMIGQPNGGQFGYRVAANGDVNNDGHSDVLFSDFASDTVFLLTNIARTGSLSITGAQSGSSGVDYGSAVTLGDLNNDGFADMAVGVRDRGAVVVFNGSSAGLDATDQQAEYVHASAGTSFGDAALAIIDDGGTTAGLIAIGDYTVDATYLFHGWKDLDGDGYGPDDCDDTDAAVNPGATERLDDGVDSDCDGLELCFRDRDADNARSETDTGLSTIMASCTGSGFLPRTAPIDCNDNNANIRPGATDLPGDGVDTDCSGTEVCYRDDDRDGARSTTTVTTVDTACAATNLALASATLDCNDLNSRIRPGATETPGDGVDSDCNHQELCYDDVDGDGARASTTVATSDVACAASHHALASATADCNDDDAQMFPGATELPGDGVDSDCDGEELCFVDADIDGFGSSRTELVADISCTANGLAPHGLDEDCDDTDFDVYPGAPEIAGDGIDSDCDLLETCFEDLDADGARSTTTVQSSSIACDDPQQALFAAPIDCSDDEPDFAATCPDFYLRDPSPGLIQVSNSIRIEHAEPFAPVLLVGGPPGTTTVSCGATFDMASFTVLARGTADLTGTVVFQITPPRSLAGRTVVVQAAAPSTCEASNSFTWAF